MSPCFSHLDQGIGQGEIWKLALSLKNFQIWDGCYSLTFNTSANWTFYIQACVRDPYVLLKRTISINESVQELFCQDWKLYTCLNSSLYNSNCSFVIWRRRWGIWLPVNQTRPWEGSPEIHALLKVIKEVLQRSKRFIGLLITAIVGNYRHSHNRSSSQGGSASNYTNDYLCTIAAPKHKFYLGKSNPHRPRS